MHTRVSSCSTLCQLLRESSTARDSSCGKVTPATSPVSIDLNIGYRGRRLTTGGGAIVGNGTEEEDDRGLEAGEPMRDVDVDRGVGTEPEGGGGGGSGGGCDGYLGSL